MPVANGMPLAAIGAREEVPPCCVTVISAYASCRQVAPAAETMARAKANSSLCLDATYSYMLYDGRTRRSHETVSISLNILIFDFRAAHA